MIRVWFQLNQDIKLAQKYIFKIYRLYIFVFGIHATIYMKRLTHVLTMSMG